MSAARYPEAVAFDCDGTIADTESLSAIAWAEVLQVRGVTWTDEDFHELVGKAFAVNWAHFSSRADLGDVDEFRSEMRARFRELFDERLEIHADAVATMRDAAARGIAIAVVSSSTRDHIERVLDRADVADLVPVIVASGDTAHKPAPDPYLAACARLDVAPMRTTGVEDTTTGARSSRAAGLWTVAVRRAHAVPELSDHAHLVVDQLRLEDLRIDPSEASTSRRRRGFGGPGPTTARG